MKNDFKKAGYFVTVVIFITGVLAIIASTVLSCFAYNDTVVMIGEFVSLFALMGLLIISVTSKSNYNKACVKFAEYILNNRKKEAENKNVEVERLKEIQNMKSAAEQERENAVAAALEQGRSEGAQAVAAHMAQQQAAIPTADAYQFLYQPYVQNIAPNEEVLYNEYGEPVMIRRRVRRRRVQSGDVLYDRYGTPVLCRAEPAAEVVTLPASASVPTSVSSSATNHPAATVSTGSAQASSPSPKTIPAQVVSSIPNPMSIPKPVPNPVPTPPPVPTVLPKSSAAPASEPPQKITPATISTTNQQGASTAVSHESGATHQYQVSWQAQSTVDSSQSDDSESDSTNPKPINLNPYKG